MRLKAGQEVIRVALYGKGLNAQLVSQSTCVDHQACHPANVVISQAPWFTSYLNFTSSKLLGMRHANGKPDASSTQCLISRLCNADGHVLNVALPDWLPQRQLLQLLTEQVRALGLCFT